MSLNFEFKYSPAIDAIDRGAKCGIWRVVVCGLLGRDCAPPCMAQSEAIDKGEWQGVRPRASGCDCVSQKKIQTKFQI